jgi:hypothetical protein
MARVLSPGDRTVVDIDTPGVIEIDVLEVPEGGGPGAASGNSAFLVAAYNAPIAVKNSASWVCDGVNDQVQIQEALDALPATGGKVELSAGTFNIAAPIRIEKDSTMFTGAGVGQRTGATQIGEGSKLNAVNGLTGQVILVQRSVDAVPPVYGVTLRDFLIDGRSVGTNVDGIVFKSNRGHIDHVHVHYCTGNGIVVRGYASPGGWDTYDTHLVFCQVGDCSLAGVWFDHDGTDDHLVSAILYNNQWNLRINAGSLQATACHFYNGDVNNVWFDSAGSRSKFTNCKIEGSGQHGVLLDSTLSGTSDVIFTSCNFKNSGDSADNTYDHFHISGPSGNGHTRTTIVGNVFSYQASVTANKPRYGVYLGPSSQDATIVANSFGPDTHWGTAPIFDDSNATAAATIRANANISEAFQQPFLNVRDFGTRGNGTTDDTAAIQAALDAIPVGGGMVWFPSGSYEISAPLIVRTDGTVLMGPGSGAREGATQDGRGARIEVDATFVGTEVIHFRRDLDDRVLFGGGISSLTISCGLIGALDAVKFRVEHGVIENVAIHQASGKGILVQGYSGWVAEHNKIDKTWVENCVGDGIHLAAESSDTTISSCSLVSNGDGVHIATPEHKITGSTFSGQTRYHLYFDNNGSRTQVTGCLFKNSGQHGVVFDSTTVGFSDIAFTGNTFKNAGTSADNTYDNVHLTGPSGNAISRITFTGNNFVYHSSDSVNKPRYALNMSSTASQHVVVVGNTFGPASHWGTSPINNASSSTNPAMLRNNVGYVTESRGTAVVASGTTTIVVTHGLSYTPSLQEITVQRTNNGGTSTKWWISTVTSTQFTINVDVDPGVTTAAFVWAVRKV